MPVYFKARPMMLLHARMCSLLTVQHKPIWLKLRKKSINMFANIQFYNLFCHLLFEQVSYLYPKKQMENALATLNKRISALNGRQHKFDCVMNLQAKCFHQIKIIAFNPSDGHFEAGKQNNKFHINCKQQQEDLIRALLRTFHSTSFRSSRFYLKIKIIRVLNFKQFMYSSM